jgi:hypothetical protein
MWNNYTSDGKAQYIRSCRGPRFGLCAHLTRIKDTGYHYCHRYYYYYYYHHHNHHPLCFFIFDLENYEVPAPSSLNTSYFRCLT